ncbi:MAG: ribbon-helix-helix protein, CopG family [Candidatus Rokubacteria bacterium]|nr:ribbon-helix-helix protein, CopG family [Candidatus Rokubacteria bacterium]
MVKVTYTFDDETVDRVRRISARLGKPQSMVVREAIKEYEARADRLSDDERTRMLGALDRLMQEPPTRSDAAVETELREIHAARRRWSRRGRRRS